MNPPRPVALQLAPFSKYLESALNARFEIVRWWELDGGAQRAWLASHAGSVRAIATGVAARRAPFGPIVYTGPHRKPVDYAYDPDLLVLAKQSDVLVVTCPANAATRHLIGAAVFAALGPESYLVNVARGSVVDD